MRGLTVPIDRGFSWGVLAVIALAVASPVAAQRPAPAASQGDRVAEEGRRPAPVQDPTKLSDDVVVEGIRDLGGPEPLSSPRTTDSTRSGSKIMESRYTFGASERFARCSIKPGMHDIRLLSLALDSTMNSVRQDNAQRRFVQSNAVCAVDGVIASSSLGLVVQPSDPNGSEMQFYYDRGALFIGAIRAFAPDLALTTAQLADPAVQARFVAREKPRARMRLPLDRQFFNAAVCLVFNQPELSIRLVTRDLDRRVRQDLAAAIVNRSRTCFAGARNVYFDTVQFRFYLADALYRWTIAAKGIDSLIPGAAGVETVNVTPAP